jgi:hypothetical protein
MKEPEDQLTAREREAFALLPTETAPPDFLEQEIVHELKQAQLIRSGRSVEWWPLSKLAYAAGLCLACVALGVALGVLWGVKRTAGTTAPSIDQESGQFMLMLRTSANEPLDRSPEELERVKEYSAWARKIRQAGLLVDGEKLTSETRIINLVDGKSVVSGNQIDPNEKPIAGYFLIRATDYQEAIGIAEDCPHLKYGGTIEIRRIDDVSK